MPMGAPSYPRSIEEEVARILGHPGQAGFPRIPRQEVNGLGLGKSDNKTDATNGGRKPLGRSWLDSNGAYLEC